MRLIDADAYAFSGDLINEPTVDAVEVVRCKECRRIYEELFLEGYVSCDRLNGLPCRNDDFCSLRKAKR